MASRETSTQIRLALRQLLQNVCQGGHLGCRDDLLGVRRWGLGGDTRRFPLGLDGCFGGREGREGGGGEEEGGEVGLGDDRGLGVSAASVTLPVLRVQEVSIGRRVYSSQGSRSRDRRTGLKAGSLALVAGVAYVSGREAGWGYRFSVGMGRPDEISGFTTLSQCELHSATSRWDQDTHRRQSPLFTTQHISVSMLPVACAGMLRTKLFPEALRDDEHGMAADARLTVGATWYFVWSADMGFGLAAFLRRAVGRTMAGGGEGEWRGGEAVTTVSNGHLSKSPLPHLSRHTRHQRGYVHVQLRNCPAAFFASTTE